MEQKISMEPKAVDVVLVIGADNPGDVTTQNAIKNFMQDCNNKGLSYKILGDGKTNANINEINSLPKSKNLVVWGHGDINKDSKEHEITLLEGARNSQQIIKQLQVQTGAKNIVALACFGGQIVNNMKNVSDPKQCLAPGTNLFIPSPADEVSLMGINRDMINMFIHQIEKDKNKELNFLKFVQDVIETNPETSVFAHVPLDKNNVVYPIQSCTMRLGDKVNDNVFAESENFTAHLIADHFNNFIKKLIQNNQAIGLGNYHDQCVMNGDLPQTNWKDVKMSRSGSNQLNNQVQIDYNIRHEKYRESLMNILVGKSKEHELRHLFQNMRPKDPATWTKQASESLKWKFRHTNDPLTGHKLGKEIQVLVEYGADIFGVFYNKNARKNESVIDNVIQSKNFSLLEIMSKTNQRDNNGYSVLDHIIINSGPNITENTTNMIELALNANPKMTLHSNNIPRLIDLANQNAQYGNYIWKAIKNNPSVLNNVLQKADSEQLAGLFLTAIKEGDRNLISFMQYNKNINAQIALNKASEWKLGDVNLIKTLINQYGAKPDAQTTYLIANAPHTIETAKLSNDDLKYAELLTAIQKNGDKEFISNLIKQKNINPKDALDKAIEWKYDVNLINTLMHDHGAKPDDKTIALAVKANPAYAYQPSAPILESLLYYADDDQKITELLKAIQRKDQRLANYLQGNGISSQVALYKAIEWKWSDVNLIDTLLHNFGVKPDVKTINLANYATQKNGEAILDSVLNCANNDQKIEALLVALQQNNYAFAEFLRKQHQVNPKDALDKAIEWGWGDVNLIDTLLNNNVKPDVKTINLANYATQKNGEAILNRVLNHANDDQKISAFLGALQQNNYAFAEFLRKQHQVNPKDALDKAIEWGWGDVNLIDTLLNNNVKPDVKTINLANYTSHNNGGVILNRVLNHANDDQKISAFLGALQQNKYDYANYLRNQVNPTDALDKAIELNYSNDLINTLMQKYGAKPDAQSMKLAVIRSTEIFKSVVDHVDDEEIALALLEDLASDNDYSTYLITNQKVDLKHALDKAIESNYSNDLINTLMQKYGAKPDAQSMKLAVIRSTEIFKSVVDHVDYEEIVLALLEDLASDNDYSAYLIANRIVDPKDALDKAIEYKLSNNLINRINTLIKEYSAGENQNPSLTYKKRIEEYKKEDQSEDLSIVNSNPFSKK